MIKGTSKISGGQNWTFNKQCRKLFGKKVKLDSYVTSHTYCSLLQIDSNLLLIKHYQFIFIFQFTSIFLSFVILYILHLNTLWTQQQCWNLCFQQACLFKKIYGKFKIYLFTYLFFPFLLIPSYSEFWVIINFCLARRTSFSISY